MPSFRLLQSTEKVNFAETFASTYFLFFSARARVWDVTGQEWEALWKETKVVLLLLASSELRGNSGRGQGTRYTGCGPWCALCLADAVAGAAPRQLPQLQQLPPAATTQPPPRLANLPASHPFPAHPERHPLDPTPPKGVRRASRRSRLRVTPTDLQRGLW